MQELHYPHDTLPRITQNNSNKIKLQNKPWHWHWLWIVFTADVCLPFSTKERFTSFAYQVDTFLKFCVYLCWKNIEQRSALCRVVFTKYKYWKIIVDRPTKSKEKLWWTSGKKRTFLFYYLLLLWKLFFVVVDVVVDFWVRRVYFFFFASVDCLALYFIIFLSFNYNLSSKKKKGKKVEQKEEDWLYENEEIRFYYFVFDKKLFIYFIQFIFCMLFFFCFFL